MSSIVVAGRKRKVHTGPSGGKYYLSNGKKTYITSKRKSSPSKRKSSPSKRKSSITKRKSSPTKRKSSPTKRKSSITKRKSSPTKRKSSPTKRKSSPTKRKSSTTKRKSSSPKVNKVDLYKKYVDMVISQIPGSKYSEERAALRDTKKDIKVAVKHGSLDTLFHQLVYFIDGNFSSTLANKILKTLKKWTVQKYGSSPYV